MEVECAVESKNLSSGAFRDAYHSTFTGKPVNKHQEQARLGCENLKCQNKQSNHRNNGIYN